MRDSCPGPLHGGILTSTHTRIFGMFDVLICPQEDAAMDRKIDLQCLTETGWSSGSTVS